MIQETLMNKGWEASKIDAYTSGYLVGSIIGALEYGEMTNPTFKSLAETVIEILDRNTEFGKTYLTKLNNLADKRNVTLKQ